MIVMSETWAVVSFLGPQDILARSTRSGVGSGVVQSSSHIGHIVSEAESNSIGNKPFTASWTVLQAAYRSGT